MSGPESPDEPLKVRIRKRYKNAGQGFELDIEFAAEPGFTILFGASGAGKTTLLDCIAGLQSPDAGHIAIAREVVFDSDRSLSIPPNRRAVGYLMQSLALFPHMSVRQNVQYGLQHLTREERAARTLEILESLRISAFAERRLSQLSGGERQRTALARTLVRRPRVLLLDEPLTALDAKVKSQILDDLRTWNREQQIPILYVTHQREEVFALGERVIALENGRIVAQGSAYNVLHRPELQTVAQLAGFENIFECGFVAAHPEQGTMTCRIAATSLDLEVPLSRIDHSRSLQIGIRAGDILLASSAPQQLSARNIFRGTIGRLEQRDVMVIADVSCGQMFEVHVTPAARDAMNLQPGAKVWLVIKTYSCQVMQNSSPGQ